MKISLPEALFLITLSVLVVIIAVEIIERETYITECEANENEVTILSKKLEGCEVRELKNNVFMRARWQIGKAPYILGDYDCFDQTMDLTSWLADEGIETNVAEGYFGELHHYWILVLIDSVTGKFVNPKQDYSLKEVRYNGGKCVCK